MPTLPRSGRVRVTRDGGAHVVTAKDEVVGRLEGDEVAMGDLVTTLEVAGTRRALRSGRSRVLRLDPGGRKATTLTLTRGRYRLARQKWVPGRRQWVLSQDVAGEHVLKVTTTPLGTVVQLTPGDDLSDHDLALLTAGSLVVALEG
jgi:hypothetical protein